MHEKFSNNTSNNMKDDRESVIEAFKQYGIASKYARRNLEELRGTVIRAANKERCFGLCTFQFLKI